MSAPNVVHQQSECQVHKHNTDESTPDGEERACTWKLRRPQTRPLTLQIPSCERRRTKIFRQMQVTRMFQLGEMQTVDEPVAKLLEFAEYPKAWANDASPPHRVPTQARGTHPLPEGSWVKASQRPLERRSPSVESIHPR